MKQVTLGQSTEGCFFDSYTLTKFLQTTSVLSADLQKCFENSVPCFLVCSLIFIECKTQSVYEVSNLV